MFNEDFKQYKGHIVRVICNDGREYVGEPTILEIMTLHLYLVLIVFLFMKAIHIV